MKKILLIVAIALIFGCDDNGTEPKNENLTLSISPSETTMLVDNTISLEVQIENVSNLFAVSMEIVFDEDLLSLPDNPTTIGDFWSDNTVDLTINDPDRLNITIGLQKSSEIDGLNGSGTLFAFELTALTIGEADILIRNLHLLDENGNNVTNFEEIVKNEGKIEIE